MNLRVSDYLVTNVVEKKDEDEFYNSDYVITITNK